MRIRTIACLIPVHLLAFAVPAASEPDDGNWTPGEKGQGHGYTYQVFKQQKEGEPFVRYQIVGTIDAEPAVLTRTARDISRDPKRAPEGQTREVILATENETILHTSIDLPMMFSDRDVVTRGVGSVDPNTGIGRIDFKSIEHPAAPPKPGFIRLTQTAGHWEFVPDGAKHSKATFETYVDLGGSLPGWLVSGMMASNVLGQYEQVAKEATKNP